MPRLENEQQIIGIPPSTAAAVKHLHEHGYENTTASELSDAMGMSRSTFFRRFGSKEDVIFTDHAFMLHQLEQQLSQHPERAIDVLTRGAIEIMHVLTRDRKTAVMRWELLRSNSLLRDREIVISHRYERLFHRYLEGLAHPHTPSWVPTALASALVAVHNATMRKWLLDPNSVSLATLERDLSELHERFSRWFSDERDESHTRVAVAVFDVNADPNDVMNAVTLQLQRATITAPTVRE